MFKRSTVQRLILAGIAMGASSLPAETSLWIFEGLLSEADPALAPDLKSGWVLSGSFSLDPLLMEEDPGYKTTSGGRLEGGVSNAELTVDLYYQVRFEAKLDSGLAGFDFVNDDPESEGRDLLTWFFPIRGQLGSSDWSLQWLQIWLVDPDGRMIPALPPRIPPTGFDWSRGWFRMTFLDKAGEVAYAEGGINLFSPEDVLDTVSDRDQWVASLADLSSRLEERDSIIISLREELAKSQERLRGLRSMVDLLVEERSNLENENTLLQEQVRMGSPESEKKVAELTSEKALLEQELSSLSSKNLALAESLGASEMERRQLMDRIIELKEAAKPLSEDAIPQKETGRAVVSNPDGSPAGTITVFERPMVIEKPVQAIVSPSSRPEEPAATPSARRYGPRKFR